MLRIFRFSCGSGRVCWWTKARAFAPNMRQEDCKEADPLSAGEGCPCLWSRWSGGCRAGRPPGTVAVMRDDVPVRELQCSRRAVTDPARLGTTSAAASVPRTVTVCSSNAAKMSSTSRSAIHGALGRNSVARRRRPALRIWAGDPNRSSSVRTAGCCNRGPVGVGQPLVERLVPGWCDGGGVVFAFADVQAEEDVDVAGVDHVQAPHHAFVRPCLGTELPHPRPHPRYGELFWLE